MKVLMVNKFLHPNGGSETYIHKIGAHLVQLGHEVQYFGMNHPDRVVGNHADSYTGEVNFRGGRFKNPFSIIYSREAYKKIMIVLKDFNPDVVHVNNFNFQLTPSILYAIKKYERQVGRKVPIIATAHDPQWVCPNHALKIPSTGELCFRCEGGKYSNCVRNKCIHDSTIKSILGSLEGYYYKLRRTYRFFDVVICPSEFMNKTLSTNPMLRGKTITVHNFSDAVLETDLDDKAAKEDYVVYFGRMSEEKGVDTAVKACERLPEIPFVFAGGGPLTDKVKSIDNIKYVGFLSGKELVKVISEARFSLFPSICHENCPFSLIETQIYGTPVIARNLGGVSELITHGQTGVLVEDNETDTWVNAIREMWENKEKCSEFSRNCKKISFYTLNRYCDILLRIYQGEIIGK